MARYEDNNEEEQAKEEQKEKEEQAKEEQEESQESESQGNSAASKFGYSMDDESDENGEQNDKDSSKKKKDKEKDKGKDKSSNNNSNTQSPETSPPGTGAGAGAGEGVGASAETGAGATAGAEASAGATAGAGAAAGGAAAGAGAGAGAAAAAVPLGIAIVIILIIIIVIGWISFLVTGAPLLWNKLKDIAGGLWQGLEGYIIGRDKVLVKQDDIIGAAQYIYDMGYDLVGMGFAENVLIYGQTDQNGQEIEVEEGHEKNEIKAINAPFLRAYLVAENRTYLINNFTFNLADFAESIFDFSIFSEGNDAWGTGLINFDYNFIDTILSPFKGIYIKDINIGELVEGVKIDREANQMRIRRANLGGVDIFDLAHNDYTYYNLEGWSGRYGKPFELSLTLHLATMAPDLVKEFALNKDLDAKVNVKLYNTKFNGKAYINGQCVDDLLNETTTEEVVTGYDPDTGDEITTTQSVNKYTGDTRDDLELAQNRAQEVNTSIPYISSVTHHWFRNVYFESTSSTGASSDTDIGVDKKGDRDEITGKDKPDGIEDYYEDKGPKTQVTRKLSTSDYAYDFGESDDEITVPTSMTITGMDGTVEFKGTMKKSIVQVRDAVRGKTNETTKNLFKKKYYIYDGTIERAKKINEDRIKVNVYGDKPDESLKNYITMTNESLSAFTILEGSETLDAQYIYRDLKELVIELGYFEREDFDVIEKKILEWPIPDYTPVEWPERKSEKQILEYGTLISSEATIANSLGLSLEEYKEIKNRNKDDEENTSDDSNILKGTLFIGDSYIDGLKNYAPVDDATYFAKPGEPPSYFLNNIKSLPSKASQVCVYMGVNGPDQIEAMKGVVESLAQRYNNAKIYIIEVMHLGKNYTNYPVNQTNSKIDVFNAQIRQKCKQYNNVFFIDASQGLVSGGYLAHPDGEGIHMQTSDYKKWTTNIAEQIKRTQNITANANADGEVDTKEKNGDGYSELVIYNSKIYRHYLQGSGSWSSFQFPDRSGCSIAGNGCGIAAAATVLSAYPKTANITPLETAKATIEEMKTSKHYWPMADDIANAMSKLGVQAKAYEREETEETATIIKEALKEGREVIARISKGPDSRFTHGLHYVTLIKYEDGEGINIINSSGMSESMNFYDGTIEEFIENYMPNKGSGNGFLVTQEATTGIMYNGFEPDKDVIAMGNGKIVEVLNDSNNLFSEEVIKNEIGGTATLNADPTPDNPSVGLVQDGVRIKLTDVALKGYTLVIYGIKLDESVQVGNDVKARDVIGKTREDSDICLILIDKDKSIVEDIENYIKVPEVKKDQKEKLLGGNAEEKVWIALKEAGYSDEAASGVMGNIFGESGFRADAVEAGSGEGIGLCQWSFGRKAQLQAYAASKGVSWQDEDTQIEFLLAELTPENTGGGAEAYAEYQFFAPYDKYKTQWENAKTVEEASVAFRMGFERPGESTARDQARIDAANRYYELYKNKY